MVRGRGGSQREFRPGEMVLGRIPWFCRILEEIPVALRESPNRKMTMVSA